MISGVWSGLPRAARIGALVALVISLPIAPFLIYAGIAVMNVAAQKAQSLVGEGPSVLVGILAFAVYAGFIVGIVVLVGSLVGLLVQRFREGLREGGA